MSSLEIVWNSINPKGKSCKTKMNVGREFRYPTLVLISKSKWRAPCIDEERVEME